MKYYLVEISEGSEKIAGKSIYEYDNRDNAIADFHSKLGISMKSELYTSELIIVINSTGATEKVEKWERLVDLHTNTNDEVAE